MNFNVHHLFRLLDTGILHEAAFLFTVAVLFHALLARSVLLSGRSAFLRVSMIAVLAVSAACSLSALYQRTRYEAIRCFCTDALLSPRCMARAEAYLVELERMGRCPRWCLFQRGVLACRKRNYGEAALFFGRVVEKEPDNVLAWNNLVLNEIAARRFSEAERHIRNFEERFGRREPGRAEALRIRLALARGRIDEARTLLERCIRSGLLPESSRRLLPPYPGTGGGKRDAGSGNGPAPGGSTPERAGSAAKLGGGAVPGHSASDSRPGKVPGP